MSSAILQQSEGVYQQVFVGGRKSLETGFLHRHLVTPGAIVRNPVSIFKIFLSITLQTKFILTTDYRRESQ